MPEIYFPPRKTANEFTVFSALLTMAAYCVHPADDQKRNNMIQVQNVEILHKFKYKYFDPGKIMHDTDTPEKAKEFWQETKDFFQEHRAELPALVENNITPLRFAELFKSSMVQLASDSLHLPSDIEQFLLYAPTPDSIRTEAKDALLGLATAMKIIVKLMQMQRDVPDIKGGLSLNKAIELIDSDKESGLLKNRTYIRDAWNKYKKSVNLFMGLAITKVCISDIPELKARFEEDGCITAYLSPGALGLALIFAQRIQDWMLSLRLSPHDSHNKGKLIKPTQLWMIPKNCNIPPRTFKNFMTKLPPLADWEIAQLQENKRLK